MKKTLFLTLCVMPLAACKGGGGTPKQNDPIVAEETANCDAFKAPEGAEKWMSWEGGLDVAGMTEPGLPMPNVLVHVASMVHTPVGSAPSGMILYQPDPKGAPAVIGFVSTDAAVAAYFGPNIFAGTPFEGAPALTGTIEVKEVDGMVTSRTEVGGHVFEVEMKAAAVGDIDRAPAQMTPFREQGTEAAAESVTVKVDGQVVEMDVLPVGIAGGPGAVWAPCGVYTP